MTDVSPSIAARMSEMAAEIVDLRAKLAAVRELCDRAALYGFWGFVRAVEAVIGAGDSRPAEVVHDEREPKQCPRCLNWCIYDGWQHTHAHGLGIGSCRDGTTGGAAGDDRGPQDEEAAEVCHYPTTHTPGCGCGALRRDEVYPVPVKPSPGPDDPAWDRLNTPGPQRSGTARPEEDHDAR